MADQVLTKADLVEAVQARMGLPRTTVARVVDDLIGLMKDTLTRGENVKISGFGNFEVHRKKARAGRDPRSGEPITISARRVLTFKPSGVLRRAMREGRTEDGL
ncbi:MAG: integration host factor subunit alpha [Thermodesulfobacteriota bacterium]